jgi:superfamily II DNA or RNA helicase
MSALADKIFSLTAEDVLALLPQPLIQAGKGLILTGDVLYLLWSYNEQSLVLSFPRRLSRLRSEILLKDGELYSQCGCGQQHPCQHFAAGLVLCVYLLRSDESFGLKNSSDQWNEFRLELLRASSNTSIQIKKKIQQQEIAKRRIGKHIRIIPGAMRLFNYMEGGDVESTNLYGIVPEEVRSFAGIWSMGEYAVQQFWQWFTRPDEQKKRMPVYAEVDGELRLLQQGQAAEFTADFLMNLEGEKVTLSRILLEDGQPITDAYTVLTETLIWLHERDELVIIKPQNKWQTWNELVEQIQDNYLGKSLKGVNSFELNHTEFNNIYFLWQDNKASFPRLQWKGQDVTNPLIFPNRQIISLEGGADSNYLYVHMQNAVADVQHYYANALANTEKQLHYSSVDGALLAAKSRFGSLCEMLWQLWLTPKGKERTALLKTLKDAAGFRSAKQVKSGVRVLKQMLSESAQPVQLLLASPEHGWLCSEDVQETSQKIAALARLVLGAYYHHEFTADDDPPLVIQTNFAMQRLPTLVEQCQKHGVELKFLGKALRLQSLNLSISAQHSHDKSKDWFELKPEIKCGTEILTAEKWNQICVTGHYVNAEGELQIIDLKSVADLQRMQSVLNQHSQESFADKEERKRKVMEELVKIPRLRVLDWIMLSKHGVDLHLPESEQAVLDSLINFKEAKRVKLPQLNAKLRDYQHAGYSWLAFLYEHGFGACLADDMGLGKTIQTIALLAAIQEGVVKPPSKQRRPSLLVVPPTLLFNWRNEVSTFYPKLPMHSYTGKGRSLIGVKQGIVLSTYELVRRDIETLREVEFDCIIFDEAQAVKNLLGERSRAMRQLQGRFKLVLTGTPLENHAGEYYSIIELALPGLFGDDKFFMDSLRQPNGFFNPIDRARPFVLRRTKEKILKELPPKVESDIYLELTDEQKKYYTRVVGEVKQEVFAAFEEKGAQQAGIVALAALTRLRQVCVSPALMKADYKEASPKIQHLCEKLQELKDEGHAALVFSQFTKGLDHLEIHLKAVGIDFLRLDGSTPVEKRKDLVERFQKADGPSLFLISLKAGGAGLNLTRASYVFHLDPWWNPAAENQASDRAHRLGQKNTVFIQRLLMLHTVEEKIMQLKAQKRELFERVMEGTITTDAAGKGAVMTREDFKFLLE